ncbi:MAG: bifunctional glutamate N-acetyltransferase/amino-acid acetyltransferase ArgJ [Acidobacteriaceae bacterium]
MGMADEAKGHVEALPQGFRWGAVRAGRKVSGNLDVAAAVVAAGGQAAVSYMRNQVVAAPVTVGRRHMASTGGRVGVVLVNAGNANCATGEAGIEACVETCVAAAERFGCIFDEVFPSSTGIIGVPLPTQKIVASLPKLRACLGATPAHADMFATAILTTDTKRKVARAIVDVDGVEVRIFGMAKGAGMIGPQMGLPVATAAGAAHATMLVYLFTDLAAEAEELRALLAPAVERSFNNISIDGDMSTNDTVLLLASGASGVGTSERVNEAFASALGLVCGSLAYQIVADGEGVGHVVTLELTGAAPEAEARQVARTIANSPLCKTAWSSGDPNWGRLLAAAGRSGVTIDPGRMRIAIGGVPVFAEGVRARNFDEAAAHAAMTEREYTIEIDLGMGEAGCRFVTCDLTAEYVRINADYST